MSWNASLHSDRFDLHHSLGTDRRRGGGGGGGFEVGGMKKRSWIVKISDIRQLRQAGVYVWVGFVARARGLTVL